MQTLFLQALDVLVLRANKLFDGPGSQGESLMPPWPSVVAGALRSRILVDDGVDLAAFARGQIVHPVLGTPSQPGDFGIADFALARQFEDGRTEILRPMPADLVVLQHEADLPPTVHDLKPQMVAWGLHGHVLPQVALLQGAGRSKPLAGFLLGEKGWAAYQAGRLPAFSDLVKLTDLWRTEARTGIGMSADTHSAEEGLLFTTRVINPQQGLLKNTQQVGFIVQVRGEVTPTSGLLRLGGDGRAVDIRPVSPAAAPDYAAITSAGRVKLVLTSPGLFPSGWLPYGVGQAQAGGLPFSLHGVTGRIVCAALPRAEVVSGWDLALNQPKTAERAVPAGSVYWLELDPATRPDDLRKLVEGGLWPPLGDDVPMDQQRRVEGFNRVHLAAAPV